LHGVSVSGGAGGHASVPYWQVGESESDWLLPMGAPKGIEGAGGPRCY